MATHTPMASWRPHTTAKMLIWVHRARNNCVVVPMARAKNGRVP